MPCSSLRPLETELLERVGARRAELCELARELIAFDTRVPGADREPREEAKLQALVAERMSAAGLDVRIWEPDPSELPPNRYPIPEDHDFHGRPQLVATARGAGGGRALLLNGHVDVVTPEPVDRWTDPPFAPRVRDGRLYGRGACDMKGGVAAMLVATEAVRALGVELAGDLIVSTVTDEESTAAGSLAVASTVRADGGVIPEPTSLQAWIGTRGSLLPAITVDGRTGHAGLAPAHWRDGGPVNAIEKLRTVLTALEQLQRNWRLRPECRHEVLSPAAIVPTTVASGEWVVSYPASATVHCHVQYLPAQSDPDGCGSLVERDIEEAINAACSSDPWLVEHPPRFTWSGDVPPSFVPPETPVAAIALEAIEGAGLERRIAERTTWFDGATFTRAGTPTIALGPGSIDQAHAVDEYVAVDELVRAAQVLALIIVRFCGTAL